MSARLRVTLRRSTVGANPSARGTIRALGLHHIGQTVEIADGPQARGQVRAVGYLVDVEELGSEPRGKAASSKKEEAAS
jgi:large subunit ribosomal protein L30